MLHIFNKQQLRETLIDKGMTFEQVQGLDIEELQDTLIVNYIDDLKIAWLDATMDGFIGSLIEYIQEEMDTDRDLSSLVYQYVK